MTARVRESCYYMLVRDDDWDSEVRRTEQSVLVGEFSETHWLEGKGGSHSDAQAPG